MFRALFSFCFLAFVVGFIFNFSAVEVVESR